MRIVRLIPILLVSLVLAAHHFRGGEPGLVGLWLSVPGLLFLRRRWVDRALQVLLLAGAAEWVLTVLRFVEIRRQLGLPWERMALILGAVAAATAVACFALGS